MTKKEKDQIVYDLESIKDCIESLVDYHKLDNNLVDYIQTKIVKWEKHEK